MTTLSEIKAAVYDPCFFQLQHLVMERESIEYGACTFELNGLKIISRNAKITPKKLGQFVTFWKRQGTGPIEPFQEIDQVDFFVVNTRNQNHFGQFVFPKAELIKRGVVSTNLKEGKRAIRVYPPWDQPNSQQAAKTQKWQLNYFLLLDQNQAIDLNRAKQLYRKG